MKLKSCFPPIVVLFLLICVPVSCLAIDVNIKATKMFYEGSEWHPGIGKRLEVWQSSDDLGVGLWAGYDPVNYCGQWGNIIGFGPGVRYRHDWLSAYLLAGYYTWDFDEFGFGDEALHYAMIRYWCPPLKVPAMFDNYGVGIKDNFGATLGVDVSKRILSSLYFDLGVFYRLLKTHVLITGYGASGEHLWYLSQDTDFGGWGGSLGFTWRF